MFLSLFLPQFWERMCDMHRLSELRGSSFMKQANTPQSTTTFPTITKRVRGGTQRVSPEFQRPAFVADARIQVTLWDPQLSICRPGVGTLATR